MRGPPDIIPGTRRCKLSHSERTTYVAVALAMCGLAMFFRFWRLNSIPGLNGDEAWYGMRAFEILSGSELLRDSSIWFTPTGNPINPFYMVPSVVLVSMTEPSITALRLPALISGIAALALSFTMCRRVLDPAVATLSTLILTILPVNIPYCRFGWDTSQTLLASVPVVFFAISIPKCDVPFRRMCWTA